MVRIEDVERLRSQVNIGFDALLQRAASKPHVAALPFEARLLDPSRIKARLEYLNISQFEAARRAGKHAHFIYSFFVGRKKTFPGDGPLRLAHALECSIEYLAGASDEVGAPPHGAIFWQPLEMGADFAQPSMITDEQSKIAGDPQL